MRRVGDEASGGTLEVPSSSRKADLLPIRTSTFVFTMPHPTQRRGPEQARVIYMLLFRAVADTLLAFGRDPQQLGGTIGVTAILDTWGKNLSRHWHLLCLVTSGALAPDGSRWIPSVEVSCFRFARCLASNGKRVRRPGRVVQKLSAQRFPHEPDSIRTRDS